MWDKPNVPAPPQTVFEVSAPFAATAPDEISLNVGDMVKLKILFRDGWSWGVNVETEQTGMLPLDCLWIPGSSGTLRSQSVRYESRQAFDQGLDF
ncbi:hypothetical protein M427DRAFT_130004 [Gonapodya prolifera JEL478]|uniref:SH3 domain-containing protein n=1 Tax=Gonapodya prolifera (strain JEL478) TaxID=1344416 RepID=A0A139B000_GONPJ|nr:hypothetical protein M427DRAFT_130004 [Gonapodya prolifera JEL478]|eukprot:KXS22287.1 hypothetical protein M427DRAFT_130004 [Gonapodya prolifera JEL478]